MSGRVTSGALVWLLVGIGILLAGNIDFGLTPGAPIDPAALSEAIRLDSPRNS